ncbi:MAG: hypothetical protein HC799_16155 [Limnothrix sp. RL_2_0]|nr:hypothetical protein [Limnothrix sp. RL_2_0]
MELFQEIAANIGLLILPIGIYIEWKIHQETKSLSKGIEENSEKIDRRFDVNENDLTVVATEVRRDIKHLKEENSRLQRELEYLRNS